MRDYGRVHCTFWSSPNIRALSDDGRALALYLLTSPHTTITGTFRVPDGYVSEDMQWSAARVSKGFAELLSNGFANRCETTKWVWIRKFLEWNPPENPNQWKAARKVASQVPSECGWKRDFVRVFNTFAADDPIPEENPCETVSQPFRNQEQEQEQDKNTSVAYATPEFEKQILDAYHELLPDLPAVRDWNDRRKRKLHARIRERLKSGKPADGVAYWRQLFAKAAASDFLCGRKTDWRCPGLEWLLDAKNFTKLIEGSYDNTGGSHGRSYASAGAAALS